MLTAKQQDHISRLGQLAQLFVDIRNDLHLQNYEWNGAPNFDADITQDEIDAIPSFAAAGLTLADVTEANYICAVLLPLIDDKMPNLYALKGLE